MMTGMRVAVPNQVSGDQWGGKATSERGALEMLMAAANNDGK